MILCKHKPDIKCNTELYPSNHINEKKKFDEYVNGFQ